MQLEELDQGPTDRQVVFERRAQSGDGLDIATKGPALAARPPNGTRRVTRRQYIV